MAAIYGKHPKAFCWAHCEIVATTSVAATPTPLTFVVDGRRHGHDGVWGDT